MGNQNQHPTNAPTVTAKQLNLQPNPIKTDAPPDIASNNLLVSQEEAERRQLGVSQLANKFHKTEQTKKAEASKVIIDHSRLLVTNLKGDKRYSLEAEVVSVPFDVILATMDPDLLESFNKLGTELKRYYEKEDEDQQQWKLHGNGFYINYELGHEVVIITNQMIYKGVVVTNKEKKIVPDEMGTLITKAGMYTGEFKNGKANGEGTYVDRKTMSEFKGKWENGLIVDGTIDNKQYEFKGLFNKKATGNGAIRFKDSGASYIGNFVEGQYDTLNIETARYKTQTYQYTGHFKAGKKEGEGCLQQFEKSSKPTKNLPKTNTIASKKLKYRPTDKYEGLWVDDYFVTTREERQNKKIRGILLKADLAETIIQGRANNEKKRMQKQKSAAAVPPPKPASQKPLSSTTSDVPMFEVAGQQYIQSEI